MAPATSQSLTTSTDTGLVLAVHPYLDATELTRRFGPLTEYLRVRLGRPVSLSVSPTYQDHIDRVVAGQVDLAYLGPASFVEVSRLQPEVSLLARIARHGRPTFQGAIIARRDSGIQTLEGLEGRRFAFGAKQSTMSYVVPRHVLLKAGIDLGDLASHEHLRDHESIALGVLVGDFDAGAVKEEVFRRYQARGLLKIAATPAISEHVFVASAELDPALTVRLRQLLLEIHEAPGGSRILTSVKDGITALTPAASEDYDSLRAIVQSVAAADANEK